MLKINGWMKLCSIIHKLKVYTIKVVLKTLSIFLLFGRVENPAFV
jgi:hypothetical protein